jgi:hypothetical protein
MKLKKLIPNPIKIGGVVYADDIIEIGKLDELSTLKLNNLIANGSVEVVEDVEVETVETKPKRVATKK